MTQAATPQSAAPEIWPGKAYPLGATFDGSGTNFAVFSEEAEKVELCHRLSQLTFENWKLGAGKVILTNSGSEAVEHANLALLDSHETCHRDDQMALFDVDLFDCEVEGEIPTT